MRRISRRVIGALALLSVGAVWVGLRTGRGPFLFPLQPSPSLRDMVEPIQIVEGLSFDDGGSTGLRFVDARGVARDICLEGTRVWEDDPSVLEGHHNLILNSCFPRGERARRVPIAGTEEKAMVRLLERWARHDADAAELERRCTRYERGEIDLDGFWKGFPERARVKQVAVSILRELRARN